jgi:hypothetical protein|tara:strand:- start:58 stop:324 length:267 start_codon:yes stop_codon:yes gene_type:complete
MKGEIIMIGHNVKFVVLKIEEQNFEALNEYKCLVDVVGTFNNMEDAKKCKDAKDILNTISTEQKDWCHVQFRIQQIFYKSFVQAEKSA